MNDPVALLLQFGFLAVLYLFLFWVARSVMKDLSRQVAHDGSAAAAEPGGIVAESAELPTGARPRLVVVAGKGHEPGAELALGKTSTLGRAASADVTVEDRFASSAHTRVEVVDGAMQIEDLGSTNGTYLNGRRLGRSQALSPGDTIRIGDTEFRYQE